MTVNATIEDFYKKTGGSYEKACAKYKDRETVEEEAMKFLHDSSFAELQTCIAASDYKGAYDSAAKLCDLCEKLCFSELMNGAEELKNKLFGADTFDDVNLFGKVRNKYELTVNALRALEQ